MIVSQTQMVNNPKQIAIILQEILKNESEIDQQKEHFWTMGLDGANVIQYIELATLGLINSSQVHPRETFRLAILKGMVSIVISHNHPSGALYPSDNDIDITNQLVEAGKILQVAVLDHVIIANGKNEYYSFIEHNML